MERLAARQLDGGRLEPGADPLGQLERAGKVGLGQDQRELLAAIASREVDVPDPRTEDLADGPQNGVARRVAVAVVDGLEVVQVQEHERERVADAVGAAPLERELLVEGAPVREAGQAVDGRLRGDPAEVAEYAQDRAREQEGDHHQERE